MNRLDLEDAMDLLDAALRTSAVPGSLRDARLRRGLEDVFDERLEDALEEMTSGLSVGARRSPLALLRGNHPLARRQGETTQDRPWSAPEPIYVEIAVPPAPRRWRLRRSTSTAIICLLDLVRAHEAEIQRLHAKVRQQRQSAELIEKRVDTLEPRATSTARDAPQQQDTSIARERTILAAIGALAVVMLLQIALVSGLAHSGVVLAIGAGLLLAIALAVVIFFLVERRPASTSPAIPLLGPATPEAAAPQTTLLLDTARPVIRDPRITAALLGVLAMQAMLMAVAFGVLLAPSIFRPQPTPPSETTSMTAVVPNPPAPGPTGTTTAAPTPTPPPPGDPKPPVVPRSRPDSTDIW